MADKIAHSILDCISGRLLAVSRSDVNQLTLVTENRFVALVNLDKSDFFLRLSAACSITHGLPSVQSRFINQSISLRQYNTVQEKKKKRNKEMYTHLNYRRCSCILIG